MKATSSKATRPSEPSAPLEKRKNPIPTPAPVPTTNRFGPLSDDEETDDEELMAEVIKKVKANERRVPPIILTHPNSRQLKECVSKITREFEISVNKQDHTRITMKCKTLEGHRLLLQSLREDGSVPFHTFLEEEEKFFKVYLSGIYHYKEEEIKELLNAQGAKAQKVVKFTTNHVKDGAYIAHFKKGDTTVQALSLKIPGLNGYKVRWSRFNKKKGSLTQCFNCQQFGHASSKCGYKPRCVKCLADHPHGECPRKIREGTAKCVNFEGDHAANYKGCAKCKEYKSNRLRMIQNAKSRQADKQQQKYVPAPAPATNAWIRNEEGKAPAKPTPAQQDIQTQPPPNVASLITGIPTKLSKSDWDEAITLAQRMIQLVEGAKTAKERAAIIFHFHVYGDLNIFKPHHD
ncbi:uncharacterized protein LOC129809334 [Phlebotomus papatasi]|uniref:uncharacterized protein LOC129809334 n=1 Tax=Phlebotomus papatasi TaxID=29031 RepID=UPI0024841FB7|nr:uncharacterized protein LOC129809334 [Phlebotomus papatasi]